MATRETRELIVQAVERLKGEVPALNQLNLVVRLELRARGGDAPIWRVELPEPKVSKDPAGDARLDVSVARPHFNELAEEGRLEQWAEAYRRGHVRVSGDAAVIKLLGQVIERRAVVELQHAKSAWRRGLDAELAEHALVEVLLDDLGATVVGRVDVHGAGLLERLRHLGVVAYRLAQLDVDEQPRHG